jgi:hypothetical protein
MICCLVVSLLSQADAFQSFHHVHHRRNRSTLYSSDAPEGPEHTSRRSLIVSMAISPFFLALLPSDPALAASPMTLGEVDGLAARAERMLRPKPPKALRPKLNQDFAVLLMRSSYNALDQIDCVPMDQFQRDFFLLRQSEYQPYVDSLGPGFVQQGDLTNSYYFDFISFAQYATISREINKDPPSVFEEQQPKDVGEGEPQQFVWTLVKRDPSLTKDVLSSTHSRLVGTTILDKLEEIFGETDSAIPKIERGSRSTSETLLAALNQLVKLFLVNGFAWDGSASISTPSKSPDRASGAQFCISLTSPATLWSGKALQLRRSDPDNAFILKTAAALVSRAGYKVASSSVEYDGNTELSRLTIQ